MSDLIATYLPIAIFVLSILAFIVSVLTEVTKNLPWLSKVPTDIEVTILSIVLTVVAFFAYAAYANVIITWYMVIGAFLGGFFVAFVAMYGWTKLVDLWNRFSKKE